MLCDVDYAHTYSFPIRLLLPDEMQRYASMFRCLHKKGIKNKGNLRVMPYVMFRDVHLINPPEHYRKPCEYRMMLHDFDVVINVI